MTRSSCQSCRVNCWAEVLRETRRWTTGCTVFYRPRQAKADDLPVIGVARPPLKKGEKPKPGVQNGIVHLRLRDISVAEVASSLDVPAHPLGGFHPAGSTSGNVEAQWKGSPENIEIGFEVDVDPPARVAARELPLTAHVQGRYRGLNDSLEIGQFRLSTPKSKLEAVGMLATSSKLRVSVTTSNLE